jgi:uncharacterized protein VcgC/VcgE DUF2780
MIPKMSRLRVITVISCATILFAITAQAQTATAKAAAPSLVSQLTKQLNVTPKQATGGAGALFGLAKSRMSAPDFGKVSAAVPGMSGLLRAAPAPAPPSSGAGRLAGLAGSLPAGSLPGNAGGLASVAGSFQKLGLSPEMIGKFVPVMTQYVQSRGGASTAHC